MDFGEFNFGEEDLTNLERIINHEGNLESLFDEVGNMEGMFPTPAHYRLARKLSQESKKEDIEKLRLMQSKYPELIEDASLKNDSTLTDLEIMRGSVISLKQIKPLLDVFLMVEHAAIDAGVPDEESVGVPESAEVRSEKVYRLRGLMGKIDSLEKSVSEFVDGAVRHYCNLVKYAIINAESRNERVIAKELERKEFRDGVARLAFGSYDAAMEYTKKQMEIGYTLVEVSLDFASAAESLGVPGDYKSKDLSRVKALLDESLKIVSEDFKKVFSEQE